MRLHELIIRWPSGIVERWLFLSASDATESYNQLRARNGNRHPPAFEIKEQWAHEKPLFTPLNITEN